MNKLTATITAQTIVIAETNDAGLTCKIIAEEARPASLADADTMLAFHSFGRTSAWDLTPAGLNAPVHKIDNRFSGTVAARLDQAIGTTHTDFEIARAGEVENGDLISDMELSGVAVVAACSTDSEEATYIHQVMEGQTWEQRYTGTFMTRQLVMRARRI